jgi:cell division protein ZipA
MWTRPCAWLRCNIVVAELRWILLAVGVLFCVGLWWWETRRQRQAADPQQSFGARKFLGQWTLSPPSSQLTSVDRVEEEYSVEEEVEEEQELTVRSPALSQQRVEPALGDAWSDEPAATQVEQAQAPPVPQEKIVTLRVIAAASAPFDGGTLVEVLRAAGLEHGKFSIFHAHAADGSALFSVASLVKPGSFDLETIAQKQFPGIVLFAVLTPGGDTGTDVVDTMLSTAKQLAHRLNGSLQDDRGAPLTLQRLAAIRADIADWRRLST